jgi:hypothetical protein
MAKPKSNYQKISGSKIAQIMSSQKVTVIGLICLFLLTFWGTLYQTHSGLFAAQEKFFRSWVVMIGVIPFPGAKLVIWVLTINLISASLFVFQWTWKKTGIHILHWGMLALLIGGGITHYLGMEAQMTLTEKSSGNMVYSLEEWELSVWNVNEKENVGRKVTAIDDSFLQEGKTFDLEAFKSQIKINAFYPNASAFTNSTDPKHARFINASGIIEIQPRKLDPEQANNQPGIVLDWVMGASQSDTLTVVLYGAENQATTLRTPEGDVSVQLRRKRTALPFKVKLIDFKKSTHTNTMMAKAYESLVEIEDEGVKREVLIYMNNPFRLKGYTLFQASFSQEGTKETSTFSVTNNPGRLLPYISSLITGFGLILHFLIIAVMRYRREKK